jgi:hypothetical protein
MRPIRHDRRHDNGSGQPDHRGDFWNFLIADRAGMRIEFIQHARHANNLPTDAAGGTPTGRTGSDTLVETAFRLLQDKTSA